ncbi:MAG: hypothetical protein RTU30_11160 [Candidatus Thorarchaeota archaeon]
MRIKTVLRDSDILGMESGSKDRIITTAEKNIDRLVSWTSLLKVMGLAFEERTDMLRALEGRKIKIWLGVEGQQQVIFMSKHSSPGEDFASYQWQ